ncbi:limostatin isoform X1 [Musca autumnalis]|uniref:limostatin isoform X1 n=1 Tax=Musca autumnalis TaxID=221902 RepID=UPI003CF4F187
MFAVNGKTLFFFLSVVMAVSLSWAQNFGTDSEVPAVLSYNSPLRRPDSLKSRPYFDFLSTLYRHDTAKTSLFQPYIPRNRRSVDAVVEPIGANAVSSRAVSDSERPRRAIVFRPLFVYRQQEVRKQEVQQARKRV